MQVRLIALDLDGTTLCSDHRRDKRQIDLFHAGIRLGGERGQALHLFPADCGVAQAIDRFVPCTK